MNDSTNRTDDVDLFRVDTPDGLEIENLPSGVALGTFSTTSTASTASCPISSATSVMTAASSG